jgi:dTDP-4-dehydrorhamnose 3,5-epimerase
MVFIETKLPGTFILQAEKKEDHRGFFARTWCQHEFEARGLSPKFVQSSISVSRKRGTLRGMHYQTEPYEEAKLIRCISGAIYDTVIDLRPLSPTFKQHFSVVLTAESYQSLYVPKKFAHGLQTLHDNTEVLYQISEFYSPEHACGVRWNDPAFGICWPDAERTISERDQTYPDFDL